MPQHLLKKVKRKYDGYATVRRGMAKVKARQLAAFAKLSDVEVNRQLRKLLAPAEWRNQRDCFTAAKRRHILKELLGVCNCGGGSH